MGSVTHPQRARDTVEMARIVFGADFLEENAVVFSLINANSPLVWDATMLGAARAYAEANQAVMMTPFILAGAMSPATVAATCAQTLAESLAGMAYVQLVRPGAPVVLGSFASSMSMQSGAPTFGTPEPALVLYVMAALARRLGVPFRSGGALTASKVPDAQAAYESTNTMQPTMLGGTNFVLHAAGWLEGGLTMGYEKFVLDNDQLGMWHAFCKGVDLSENGQALDAFLTNEPGTHFLGHAHTLANFETAFYRSPVADNSSFEQWEAEGASDAAHARERALEASARRVRAAASRRRRRRGARRVDRPAEGLVPGLGRMTTVTDLLEHPRYEVIPFGGIEEAVLEHVPTEVTVTVTTSPEKGLEPTLDLAERLAEHGYEVVPHLAARHVRDRAHLAEIVARMRATGASDVLVLARRRRGAGGRVRRLASRSCEPWPSSGIRSETSASRATRRATPLISDAATIKSMFAKEEFATYIVSQICFDPQVTAAGSRAVWERGTRLPIYIGLPGAVPRTKLLRVSSGFGVGDSIALPAHRRRRTLARAASTRIRLSPGSRRASGDAPRPTSAASISSRSRPGRAPSIGGSGIVAAALPVRQRGACMPVEVETSAPSRCRRGSSMGRALARLGRRSASSA